MADTSDSVRVVNEDYVNRIHSRAPTGHIHRGHGTVAANASIPTKFQTIVTDNSDKKGFLIKSARFERDAFATEAPAPGTYINHEKFLKNSPSFSKKGTGGFASKSKRHARYLMSNAPGPAMYALPSLLSSRRDFSKGYQSVFSQPIAEHTEKENGVPAPNSYEVLKTNLGKVNNVSANAAFKSQSKREIQNISKLSQAPAPCQYTINDALLHESPKILLSSFKSKSKRELMKKQDEFPGPGYYKPNEEIEPAHKLIFPRKHYLCISAPAMPLPIAPPLPGPGSYELVDYEGPNKHYMSSAAFVSTTSRWSGNNLVGKEQLPGPAHYRPIPVVKQSFIYNSAGRWI